MDWLMVYCLGCSTAFFKKKYVINIANIADRILAWKNMSYHYDLEQLTKVVI